MSARARRRAAEPPHQGARRKPLSPREKRIRQRLKDDFPHYASRCLRIRPKEVTGGELPALKLNRAQLYIHERLEAQLKRRGFVRAIVLKGRQQGCSTYVEARFYWRVSHLKGVRAYILTHEDAATVNLFDMAKRYHDHVPALVKPSTSASNAKELLFDRLSSGYKVGTAGAKGTGRSSTIQYFHGSEVAFWPNAATHMRGVMEGVPTAPGTEVILESTSDGPQGLFHHLCMAALLGENDFELIFVPWFWQEEYRREVQPGFERTSEEERYAALCREAHGYELDDAQLAWRRAKISVYEKGIHDFRREYPATVEEAFKAAAVGALWTQELLDNSRAELPKDAEGKPLPMVRVVVAVDPAGGDGPDNDEVGIVCAGKASNGHAYVWLDASGKYSAEGWAAKALALYEKERADAVVGEKNYGGDMVETNVRTKAREMKKHVTVKVVTATRGKAKRAAPVAALYERGMAHHVVRLPALEDEQTTWVPGESDWSPNRMDAVVWALTELMLGEGTATFQVGSYR
ncbi:hypothetical protein D7Y15_23395 [Corallococcus sp. AB030]|uniref:phage terminase large subunit family protein n=1 Tax=Corallococcus sp. AB030 TaxID=2316716 RepID=UPI000EE41020|nr:hypothetical protein [Corallococcus sp. AB030]RKI09724.1 hypothetical protein D7Y15_23395 [Corallococcus sp. AB030]